MADFNGTKQSGNTDVYFIEPVLTIGNSFFYAIMKDRFQKFLR